jgi:hypothetical protein
MVALLKPTRNERYGRHVGTRTPDLYRVKEQLTNIFNNFESTDGTVSHWKYSVREIIVYHDVYHDVEV